MGPHRVHQQILRSLHLFEPLSEEQLDELLESSQLLNLEKGDTLFIQGEKAQSFYFIISGCVKIYRLTPDGQEKIFEVIGDRQTFAEAMMLMDTPNYVASAQAVGPSQLFRFSNAAYMRLLQANQRLTFALIGKLCIRLHQRLNEIDTLTLANASRRVVRFLCQEQEACNGPIQLNVPKRLIASQLGIQPETFSRILHRMIDAGVIAMERRNIRILDTPSLVNYCD